MSTSVCPDVRDLASDELDQVSGGFKWQSGTKNSHVIDARGGSIRMGEIVITFDRNGDLSSISGPK